MRSKSQADFVIERLIMVRSQIDTTIENLNSHHVIVPDGYVLESTGILLVGASNDEEMNLVVFGRENYLVCAKAMEEKRK